MLDYTEDLIDTIKQLRELGITISLDDFGTGYSSLNYLKNSQWMYLKLIVPLSVISYLRSLESL